MRFSQRLVLRYIRTKFKILSTLSKRKAAEKALQMFFTPQYRNRKKLPRIFEQAEKLQFHFKGTKVRGYRWNHPAEKKAIILHGFESSVINFDRYVKPLTKKGYEVLAFDAPAHGRSTGKILDAVIYKEFIHYINEHYGPVKSYIAHSMGGLALSLYLENIKHDDEHKAVLIAPATESTTAANSLYNILKLDKEVQKEFDLLVKEKSGNDLRWYSVRRAAKKIKAQVLWFHDKDDNMTPLSDVEPIIKEGHPNFKFIITEGLGHRRIYRDNKVSKAIIDFL